MKTPILIVCTWALAIVLFLLGIYMDSHVVMMTNIIIMVVISCTISILDAIHEK
jgi:hypothetical protein